MADLPPASISTTRSGTPAPLSDDTSMSPNGRPPTTTSRGMPRWVQVFVIIAILLVVVFVILHLTGNGFGDHMHMSTIERGAQSL